MIFATLLLATVQIPDTVDVRAAFRQALVAAIDTILHDEKFVRSAEHIQLDLGSFRKLAHAPKNDTTDWTSLATALGDKGTTLRGATCGANGFECPIVSATALARTDTTFEVTLALRQFRHSPAGVLQPSRREYIVKLVRVDSRLVVKSVTHGWID
jgi:hypothetical protein